MENKNFVNGFQSWMRTYFETVSYITHIDNSNNPIINERYKKEGYEGVYRLAEEITDEFESINKDKNWKFDEHFEEIQLFLLLKFKVK